MTAVTFLRRPDDLLARMWPDGFPGRAANPHEFDVVGSPPRPQPRTPTETAAVYPRRSHTPV